MPQTNQTKIKNTMKKILSIIGIAALLAMATSSVEAQASYGYSSLSIPATLTNAATTNFVSIPNIDVRRSQVVTISIFNTQSGGDVSNVVYTLAPSLDGTRYDTNTTITLTGGGATGMFTTNITVAGVGYLGLIKETSPALHTVTNNYFLISVKRQSP
jgi:hypothetical protein